MPVSADTTQIAIVEEVTYGVTPATPAFDVFTITGESLANGANTQLSNSLNANRQTQDSILTGMDVAGSLDFEFSKSAALTILLESVMGSATVSSTTDRDLFVGNTQKSYTVEKRWPDPAGTPGVDYLYHRFVGCVSNTATITMTAGEPITGSIGIIGKELQTDDAIIAGATYTDMTLNVFRGPDVASITLDNVGGTLSTALSGVCVTDTTININNNYRGIECLGTLGNKEVVIGTFECSYDQTIFFNSNDLMDEFLAQGIVDETIVIGSVLVDNHYQFIATRGKIASNDVVAGGQGTDVVNAVTINWLYDSTAGTPTSLEISTSEGL